jgi:hypothetical protein
MSDPRIPPAEPQYTQISDDVTDLPVRRILFLGAVIVLMLIAIASFDAKEEPYRCPRELNGDLLVLYDFIDGEEDNCQYAPGD